MAVGPRRGHACTQRPVECVHVRLRVWIEQVVLRDVAFGGRTQLLDRLGDVLYVLVRMRRSGANGDQFQQIRAVPGAMLAGLASQILDPCCAVLAQLDLGNAGEQCQLCQQRAQLDAL